MRDLPVRCGLSQGMEMCGKPFPSADEAATIPRRGYTIVMMVYCQCAFLVVGDRHRATHEDLPYATYCRV